MEEAGSSIYRNLMAVGLLGLAYKVSEDAETINSIIEATLDKPLQFRMVRGIVGAMCGDGENSKKSLAAHVEQNPSDAVAGLAYAITLMLAGDPDGKAAFERILATADDPDIRKSAYEALEVLQA